MIERSEDSIQTDAVASCCSHGGEEPMAIADRSHDSAGGNKWSYLEEPTRCETHGFYSWIRACPYCASETVDDTADANLRAQRGHGEG